MIDRYLMNLAEEDARLEEEFAERVVELLNSEWNPDKFENFMEAITEECLYKAKEGIEFALLHTDYEDLGRLVFKQVEEYCIRMAEDQANQEFARDLN